MFVRERCLIFENQSLENGTLNNIFNYFCSILNLFFTNQMRYYILEEYFTQGLRTWFLKAINLFLSPPDVRQISLQVVVQLPQTFKENAWTPCICFMQKSSFCTQFFLLLIRGSYFCNTQNFSRSKNTSFFKCCTPLRCILVILLLCYTFPYYKWCTGITSNENCNNFIIQMVVLRLGFLF